MASTAQQLIQSGFIPAPTTDVAFNNEIERALRSLARSPKSRDTICNYMQREHYIYQMLDAFEIAEKEENLEALHSLCSCMQTIREFRLSIKSICLGLKGDSVVKRTYYVRAHTS